MNTRQRLFAGWLALLACLPLAFMPASAGAQQRNYPAPVITGFDVQQVRQLTPGYTLEFTLRGTPGAQAQVAIDGITAPYYLREVDAGVYQGSYTLRTNDRLTANTLVNANLRLGNQVATAVLDESLLAGAPWRSNAQRAADAAAPRIEKFTAESTNRYSPGSQLYFTLLGTPGAKVSVRMNGSKGKTWLNETSPGKYEGTHNIANIDRVDERSRAVATLRSGGSSVTAALGSNAVMGAAPASRPVACLSCGVVEAVNVVEVKGQGNYLGMIAGGVVGALLGSQVGGGSGKTAAQVVGAAGGAYAGNEIAKRVNKDQVFEVVTRLEGGGTQAISFNADPGFKVGDRVRVENNTLVRM